MIIENFKFDSVKVLNEDIVIKYHTATDNAVQTYELKTRPPHPDFINSVSKFISYYEQVFGFTDLDFDTTVKGITVKDTKLQLTGMLASVNGSMCSLNTPFFEMDNDELDFSKIKLDALIENVRTESWKFIYEKKTSQISLENDLFPKEELIEKEETDMPELSHSDLKQFIKLTILNKPTSKKYFGNYTNKKTEELQQLVSNYKEENFRITIPE